MTEDKPSPSTDTPESLEDQLTTANGKRFAARYGSTLMDMLESFKTMAQELDYNSYSFMLYSISIGAQQARQHMDMTLEMLRDDAPSA